jgi:hypothetical protein
MSPRGSYAPLDGKTLQLGFYWVVDPFLAWCAFPHPPCHPLEKLHPFPLIYYLHFLSPTPIGAPSLRSYAPPSWEISRKNIFKYFGAPSLTWHISLASHYPLFSISTLPHPSTSWNHDPNPRWCALPLGSPLMHGGGHLASMQER